MALSLNKNILPSRVYRGQVIFDNRLAAVEPLGWLGSWWLMKFTGVVSMSGRNHEGQTRGCVHTEGICPNVVTGEIVHLRKFAAMNRAKVKEVLHTLPH